MNNLKQNLIFAFIAQGTSTFLSILISLILPRVLGINEFAYWQLFTFYSGYVGLFHFGLSDGLYLRYGGTNITDMNKSLIGSQFRYMVIWQIIISSIVLVIIPFVITDPDRFFVWVMSAIYLITANAAWCLGYIFQAANETKVYSKGMIISRLVFIVTLLTLVFMKFYDFKIYIILFVLSQIIALIYFLFKGYDFVISKWTPVRLTVNEIFSNMKIGICLTFSNIASSLILGLGRGFVDNHWDITAFGIFSLAISLVNFVLQFITQVSMVLFPVLRQMSYERRNEVYKLLRDTMGLVLCGVLIFYVPMRISLSWWLPEYSESLEYLSIILPICVFDGKMQMLYNTYMKVFRRERSLLYINVFSCVLSFGLSILLTFIDNRVTMVVCAMVIAIGVRSIISSIYLSKVMRVELESNLIFEIILTIAFIFLNLTFLPWTAFFFYTTFFAFLLFARRKKLKELLVKIKNIRNMYE